MYQTVYTLQFYRLLCDNAICVFKINIVSFYNLLLLYTEHNIIDYNIVYILALL